jgi:hypothetical protein
MEKIIKRTNAISIEKVLDELKIDVSNKLDKKYLL